MPAVLKVLNDVHHSLRVLRQLQLLLPVLGDLKDLQDDDGNALVDKHDDQDDNDEPLPCFL